MSTRTGVAPEVFDGTCPNGHRSCLNRECWLTEDAIGRNVYSHIAYLKRGVPKTTRLLFEAEVTSSVPHRSLWATVLRMLLNRLEPAVFWLDRVKVTYVGEVNEDGSAHPGGD